MDYFVFLIGTTAACLTTAAFLPQVIKAHTSKQTRDLSMATIVLLAVGVTLWAVYGIFLQALPIIIANSITLVLALDMMFLKRKYG